MLLAALLLSTLPAAPTVAVAFQPPVGLTDDELSLAKSRFLEEVGSFGVDVIHAEPVDPACVPDPACVETARAGLAAAGEEPPVGLIVVEMLRVGPVVQLTATAASSSHGGATGSHGLDEQQLTDGALLPPDVNAWAAKFAPALAEEPPPPPPPGEPPPPAAGLSTMQLASIGVGAAGGVLAIVGVVLVATSEPVLQDPTSAGADKESAATAGLTGLAVGLVGVALVGAGAGLFFTE